MENNHVQASKDQGDSHYKRVRPVVDIFDNDEEVLLVADMPGVCKEDLHIQVVDGKLEISGIRNIETFGRQTWQEFENIEYITAFKLSKELDGAEARAEFVDGVLSLHLPRLEGAKSKKIQVQ